MKVDLTTPVKDFEGQAITEGKDEKKVEIGVIIRNALGARNDKESGDKMLKKYKLGLKCVADKVELSAEEVTLIKKCIEDLPITPLVYGRLVEIIDPDALKD